MGNDKILFGRQVSVPRDGARVLHVPLEQALGVLGGSGAARARCPDFCSGTDKNYACQINARSQQPGLAPILYGAKIILTAVSLSNFQQNATLPDSFEGGRSRVVAKYYCGESYSLVLDSYEHVGATQDPPQGLSYQSKYCLPSFVYLSGDLVFGSTTVLKKI